MLVGFDADGAVSPGCRCSNDQAAFLLATDANKYHQLTHLSHFWKGP